MTLWFCQAHEWHTNITSRQKFGSWKDSISYNMKRSGRHFPSNIRNFSLPSKLPVTFSLTDSFNCNRLLRRERHWVWRLHCHQGYTLMFRRSVLSATSGLKIGAAHSSETSLNIYQTTLRHIPEDSERDIHSHLRENLKCYMNWVCSRYDLMWPPSTVQLHALEL
jgi:hypothetical protein